MVDGRVFVGAARFVCGCVVLGITHKHVRWSVSHHQSSAGSTVRCLAEEHAGFTKLHITQMLGELDCVLIGVWREHTVRSDTRLSGRTLMHIDLRIIHVVKGKNPKGYSIGRLVNTRE